MRLSRLTPLFVAVAVFAACGKDNVTDPTFPPLAGVRFINSVNDTSALDFRAIDQIAFSPVANALAFRGATEFQPTEAKARHFRVFVTSQNIAIASHPIVDTTVTFAANTNYTMLLTGSARGTVQFVVITEDAPATAASQIAVRTANMSAGAIDNYIVDSTTTPVSGSQPSRTSRRERCPSTSCALPESRLLASHQRDQPRSRLRRKAHGHQQLCRVSFQQPELMRREPPSRWFTSRQV